MRKALISCIIGLAFFVMPRAANAVVYVETGDAGDLPATSQSVGASTTQISGIGAAQIDMFGFSWAGGALTIDTFGSTFTDPILYLFDSGGLGIAGNDDGGVAPNVLQSQLVFATLA